MATYGPPKRATAFIMYTSLVQQADTRLMKGTPTLAAGDFKVSQDGGALANLATLPTVTPAAGVMIKISLSAAEMTGDNVTIVCSDAAGAEWCDQVINLQTTARQIDDLAYPATSGRSIVVDASGLVDSNVVKLGPTGSGTAQTARDVGASVIAASVTGSVGSVTGAVGSVTGAVGSVTGAVGSVTGAVGSVTGNVGGNVVGSVGSVAASGIGATSISSAGLNTIADAVLDRNMATGTDSGTDSTAVRTARQALRSLRNKVAIAAGVATITKEDDTTASWTAAITTTAGNPISTVDPT